MNIYLTNILGDINESFILFCFKKLWFLQKIKKDFYKEINELCKNNNISFFNKKDNYKEIFLDGDGLLKEINSFYRGFAPLVNKEERIGVSALFANESYDMGDIILQKAMNITYPIKIDLAIKRIEPLYFDLVYEIFNKLQTNKTK